MHPDRFGRADLRTILSLIGDRIAQHVVHMWLYMIVNLRISTSPKPSILPIDNPYLRYNGATPWADQSVTWDLHWR